ncbi:MAG: murein transglycosylase A [Burkholderiales bacterium]|jgi:membrane-bound lytic murein transglycosylase A|nr:murein transglycosylase A [Burkholderiales bacterium]
MTFTAVVVALVMAACRSTPDKPAAAPVSPPPVAAVTPAPAQPALLPEPASAVTATAPITGSHLRRGNWTDLPGWREDDPAAAWEALLTSCGALKTQEAWRAVCAAALAAPRPDREHARRFFELNFLPYQLHQSDGGVEGLATGYYEPLLRGSRKPTARYRYPVYGTPDDLISIDLPAFGIDARESRLRARLDGKRVVPYFDRAQIEAGAASLRGREIAWVDDPVELFFLQIQGSGRLDLDGGGVMRLGFADHNGHPYRSIGRLLIDRGELPAERASMQGIKAWAQQNPDKLREVLDYNPRYIFFRELPAGLGGPLGALGVPLTARRSIAVDPRFVPLGAPVFLATTWPLSNKPLNQLMLAQDTGSAIRGAVRADFFWGYGDEAGREAGRMKQSLRMWVLLPQGYPVASAE